jgi:signal transduction histidine kinase
VSAALPDPAWPAGRAECDQRDRLLAADEPLAALQVACGGTLPGHVAVPELLALVRTARTLGNAVSSTIRAHDGIRAVSFRAEAQPRAGGCALVLCDWLASLLPISEQEPVLDPAAERLLGALIATAAPTFPARDIAAVLRRPASEIVADAEAIRARLGGPLAERYATYAGDIAAAGRHLMELVEDLAVSGDPTQPGATTAAVAIDLAEIADRAVEMLQPLARQRAMVVESPAPGGAFLAQADPRRVLQIVVNLLGNALKYAPLGSTVRLVCDVPGRGRVTLSVIDQGPGLDPAQQARMFDKFERLGRSDPEGSGLGLTISRTLARAMGGELTVGSAQGRGTRLVLELPAG